jgi:membrane-associated phospholipid phosphatase
MTDSGPSSGGSALDRLHAWDVAAYRAVAGTSTPLLDEPLRRLSDAANYSRVSMAAAAVLAVAGGGRGRRAALTGLAAAAITSAAVNIGVKLVARRERPDREGHGVVEDRHVEMPTSTSFPSGHSAAAFAFAAGVRSQWPAASTPLFLVAGAVAYSRVHTGVHYPGDVLIGSAIGLVAGTLTGRGADALRAAAGNQP